MGFLFSNLMVHVDALNTILHKNLFMFYLFSP